MVWTVGFRSPGETEWEVMEDEYPSMEAAELDLLAFVSNAARHGLLVESVVLLDGEVHHHHSAPRLLSSLN